MPYDGPCITALLRRMPSAELLAAKPVDFQRWPGHVAIKADVIQEMIALERAGRGL